MRPSTSEGPPTVEFIGGELGLRAALREGESGALAVVFDRHADRMAQILVALLGPDADLVPAIRATLAPPVLMRMPMVGVDLWLTRLAVDAVRVHLRWRVPAALRRLQLRLLGRRLRSRGELRDWFRVLAALPVEQRLAVSVGAVLGLPEHLAAIACSSTQLAYRRRFGDGARTMRALFARTGLSPAVSDGSVTRQASVIRRATWGE